VPAAIAVVGYIMVIDLLGAEFNLNFATTSTLNVLLTGIISLNALLIAARPLNRFKIGLVALMAILFALAFLVGGQIFSLVNLLDWQLAMIYLPLMLSAYPVFVLLQNGLGRRVLSKIHWK